MAMAARAAEVEPSDPALIERTLQGDQQAFEILYERYFPRIFSFTNRRMKTRADTEEVVQEAFINVFSALHSYRGEAPFAAWVLGVTRRTIANRFKRKRHPTVPLDGGGDLDGADIGQNLVSSEASPLEHYECGERIAQLEHAATHDLSPEQRKLFELHHLHHRPIQEIARTLHKSEDSIKSNLYRARKTLLAR